MKKFARSKPNWTRGRQHNRKFTSLRGKNARDKKGALNRDNILDEEDKVSLSVSSSSC